jgi:hypothetical protein
MKTVKIDGAKYQFRYNSFHFDKKKWNLSKMTSEETENLAHAILEAQGQSILQYIEASPEELPATNVETTT